MRFFLKNMLSGLLWLAVLLAAYLIFEKNFISHASEEWIEKFYSQPFIVYSIYFASEFFFGIIPPEFFMIWALKRGNALNYALIVAFLAIVSYIIGYIIFLIGQIIYKKTAFRYIRRKFLRKTWYQVKRYGEFLIIVAAMTPVPWAATCLLVGSSGYPSKRFLLFAISRLIRYAIYGFIVYQTHHL